MKVRAIPRMSDAVGWWVCRKKRRKKTGGGVEGEIRPAVVVEPNCMGYEGVYGGIPRRTVMG